MTHNLNRLLALLLLLTGVPFYLLLLDNRAGNAAPKPLHIAALRQLAASLPGPAPVGIEQETVATRYIIGDMIAAGSGLKLEKIACLAWRLPVPDRGPVMIDASQPQNCVRMFGMSNSNPATIARIAAANAGASISLQTGDHPHNPAIPSARPVANGVHATAVAPGVVVVTAPSLQPGDQLIYIRLQNGRELLFTGDIATISANWINLRARSVLLDHTIADKNRPEVYAWLHTIRQLATETPGLLVIPGHDLDWVASRVAKHTIDAHFSSALGSNRPSARRVDPRLDHTIKMPKR